MNKDKESFKNGGLANGLQGFTETDEKIEPSNNLNVVINNPHEAEYPGNPSLPAPETVNCRCSIAHIPYDE